MEYVIVFIVIFLLVNGYIFLEEEIIIIGCFFVWLDAAGGLIRGVIKEELENRGDIVKKKFIWYMEMKCVLLASVIEYHKSRLGIWKGISSLYVGWWSKTVKGLKNVIEDQKGWLTGGISIEIIIHLLVRNAYLYQASVVAINGQENVEAVVNREEREESFFGEDENKGSSLNMVNYRLE